MEKNKILDLSNDNVIKITHAAHDRNHIFTMIQNEALFDAMKNLDPMELNLFLYFASHQQGYAFVLNAKSICKYVPGDEENVKMAISSLIQKGYLVPDEYQSNKYIYVQKGA